MRTLALATHSSRLGKKSKLRLPREFPNLLGKLPPLAGYVVVRVFRYGVPRLSRQPLALLRLGQAPFDSRRVHGRQFSSTKEENPAAGTDGVFPTSDGRGSGGLGGRPTH